ncbi:hypothetical protein NZA98_33685, partial [Escherichia coli]|nr:hypothetical protein [Escherichia coli]
DEARRIGADGVNRGHIQHATIEEIDGIEYINTGDWVESCTAIVEHHDGKMELISWTHLIGEKAGFAPVVKLEDKRPKAANAA